MAIGAFAASLTAVVLAQAQFGNAGCPAGKEISAETAGQCCWPGQAWSTARKTCVGVPQCPAGLMSKGEDCSIVCVGGREVGPDTAGHCCWPGQAWSASRSSCVGIPRCPSGLELEGETCAAPQPKPAPVPVAAPAAAPAPAQPAAAPVVAQPAPAPSDAPVAVKNGTPLAAREIDGVMVPAGHHVEKRARLGLLIPGIALWGVGWLAAIGVSIGAAAYVAYEPTNTCWGFAAATAWIPLAGPAIAIAGQDNPTLTSDSRRPDGTLKGCREGGPERTWYAVGLAIAIVDTIFQGAGFILTIIGAGAKRTVVVEDEAIGHRGLKLEWYVGLGAPGSPMGLTLGVKGW
jgi:hypothetical protein